MWRLLRVVLVSVLRPASATQRNRGAVEAHRQEWVSTAECYADVESVSVSHLGIYLGKVARIGNIGH